MDIYIRGQGMKSKRLRRVWLERYGRKRPKEGMVTPGRLELPTRSLGNCCSIHLSYGATCRIINNFTPDSSLAMPYRDKTILADARNFKLVSSYLDERNGPPREERACGSPGAPI